MNQERVRYNRSFLTFFIVFFLFFAGYGLWEHYTSYPDTPVEVRINGTTIVPGRTTAAELLEQGYTLTYSVPKQRLASGPDLEPELYYEEIRKTGNREIKGGGYESARLLWENAEAARLGLVNLDGSVQPILQCTVYEISLKPLGDMQESGGTADSLTPDLYTVDGISLASLTTEKITGRRGKPKRQYEEEAGNGESLSVLVWEGSHYGLSVKEKDDGGIWEVSVR